VAAPPSSRIVAIYPGSFDPITNGHLDMISRGSKLADRLIVAVLQNQRKTSLFTVEERVEMLTEVVTVRNVEIGSFHGLLVDYVASRTFICAESARFQIRYELQIAHMNRLLSLASRPCSMAVKRIHQLATGERSGVARQRLRTGAAVD
jgi:pantetheine-phosphate adenylyltransferase